MGEVVVQRPPRNQKIRTGFDSVGTFSVAPVASSTTRYAVGCSPAVWSGLALFIDAQPERAAATVKRKMLRLVISHLEADFFVVILGLMAPEVFILESP